MLTLPLSCDLGFRNSRLQFVRAAGRFYFSGYTAVFRVIVGGLPIVA